mmetsp:Transcript_40222/g.86283  ORF Transcript_40222/g.86283 Transcript_40222/m.86283 type:complete len:756 (-) Transcript_40222:290-2557(-)|eukprot:CAMPEP_0206492810 /NCGR_PEP_ID=MMETSP0324_2-20121206/46419_1 /ASSEMBLY_ACC=CAM_ASM_000836 /TAXON_ID=2866 /ORGANISM="Crypthecodinium cohnii, Strain Seligo" /LENGTH=755 /DNA_ID=CAMNT_0053975475 /DNA_START=100 /DNA_END=2367 /DNA_ORIENTATION=-
MASGRPALRERSARDLLANKENSLHGSSNLIMREPRKSDPAPRGQSNAGSTTNAHGHGLGSNNHSSNNNNNSSIGSNGNLSTGLGGGSSATSASAMPRNSSRRNIGLPENVPPGLGSAAGGIAKTSRGTRTGGLSGPGTSMPMTARSRMSARSHSSGPLADITGHSNSVLNRASNSASGLGPKRGPTTTGTLSGDSLSIPPTSSTGLQTSRLARGSIARAGGGGSIALGQQTQMQQPQLAPRLRQSSAAPLTRRGAGGSAVSGLCIACQSQPGRPRTEGLCAGCWREQVLRESKEHKRKRDEEQQQFQQEAQQTATGAGRISSSRVPQTARPLREVITQPQPPLTSRTARPSLASGSSTRGSGSAASLSHNSSVSSCEGAGAPPPAAAASASASAVTGVAGAGAGAPPVAEIVDVEAFQRSTKGTAGAGRAESSASLLAEVANSKELKRKREVEAALGCGTSPEAMQTDSPREHSDGSAAMALESPFAADDKDIQKVSEYAEDIFEDLLRLESLRAPSPHYLEWQRDINKKMRGILLDWLVEVHMRYRFRLETLYLAQNIVDRYLSVRQVSRRSLQLVGTTAMMIAAKFEEIDVPKAAEFAYITDDSYLKDEILRMECTILTALDFEVVVPTAAHFLNRLLRANCSDQKQKTATRYMLELFMMDIKFLKYSPSHVVSAAIMLSNEMAQRDTIWPAAMARHTQYQEQDLRACSDELQQHLMTARTSSLTAVKQKYQSEALRRAADGNFPSRQTQAL